MMQLLLKKCMNCETGWQLRNANISNLQSRQRHVAVNACRQMVYKVIRQPANNAGVLQSRQHNKAIAGNFAVKARLRDPDMTGIIVA